MARVDPTALNPSKQDTYRRVLDAIKFKREHKRYSLAHASKLAGTSSRTVASYAPQALYKRRGRYYVHELDRLPRTLYLYDDKGKFAVATRSSKTASRIGAYHNAVRAYAAYGDASALSEFEGETITAAGKKYQLVTDARILNRLARAGELHFLDLYVELKK